MCIDKPSLINLNRMVEKDKSWDSIENCKRLISVYEQCNKIGQEKILMYAKDILKLHNNEC